MSDYRDYCHDDEKDDHNDETATTGTEGVCQGRSSIGITTPIAVSVYYFHHAKHPSINKMRILERIVVQHIPFAHCHAEPVRGRQLGIVIAGNPTTDERLRHTVRHRIKRKQFGVSMIGQRRRHHIIGTKIVGKRHQIGDTGALLELSIERIKRRAIDPMFIAKNGEQSTALRLRPKVNDFVQNVKRHGVTSNQ